jgi:hypothetical protein
VARFRRFWGTHGLRCAFGSADRFDILEVVVFSLVDDDWWSDDPRRDPLPGLFGYPSATPISQTIQFEGRNVI